MELIKPDEFARGQYGAVKRLLNDLETERDYAHRKAENPCEDDELYTKSYWRGEEMGLSLAMSVVKKLVAEIESYSEQMEANEF